MKPLRWQTNAKQAAYMKDRKKQNLELSKTNPNENWLFSKLKTTDYKWTRQATWGYRIFDFWCHHLGIAVECDGPEHDKDYDSYRDEYNLRRSGLIVLRVRNMNEEDAAHALSEITVADSWKARRDKLGLNGNTKASRRRFVTK